MDDSPNNGQANQDAKPAGDGDLVEVGTAVTKGIQHLCFCDAAAAARIG